MDQNGFEGVAEQSLQVLSTPLQHESYYVVDGKIITLRQYSIRGDSQ